MDALFLFPEAQPRDPAVEAWLHQHEGALGALARHWFGVLRACGPDVRELLHDGHPTACVGTAAFAYINVFSKHVNLGFFRGATLADPAGLLQGTGKRMRHVKLMPEQPIASASIEALIASAYADMRARSSGK
ncbi:DUF1801 domain-containing protein [Massilia sp. TS11]|uniref:DUF1801 domain-containing protein n=1 Tax=Massilia sp. TS11 TaxID=2908003 RepID=UPI001EDBAFCB|nr:DUF1801 domain-containing protein [Massilia sp. TS11]MCG2583171.1 DUF1801 domain-containing protein [Massilia sp. TS11]